MCRAPMIFIVYMMQDKQKVQSTEILEPIIVLFRCAAPYRLLSIFFYKYFAEIGRAHV